MNTPPRRVRCVKCEKFFPGEISLCARCKSTEYCSAECQETDWPKHQQFCKQVKRRNRAANALLAESGQALFTPGSSLYGADIDDIVEAWSKWSWNVQAPIVDLYKHMLRVGSAGGRRRMEKQTLFLEVVPVKNASAYRDQFRIESCRVGETDDNHVIKVMVAHKRQADGNHLGSLIFEIKVGAVVPGLPRDKQSFRLTTQLLLLPETVAATPSISKCVAWDHFQTHLTGLWDAAEPRAASVDVPKEPTAAVAAVATPADLPELEDVFAEEEDLTLNDGAKLILGGFAAVGLAFGLYWMRSRRG